MQCVQNPHCPQKVIVRDNMTRLNTFMTRIALTGNMLFVCPIQCVNTMDKFTNQVTPSLHLMGVTHGECVSTLYYRFLLKHSLHCLNSLSAALVLKMDLWHAQSGHAYQNVRHSDQGSSL